MITELERMKGEWDWMYGRRNTMDERQGGATWRNNCEDAFKRDSDKPEKRRWMWKKKNEKRKDV